MAAIAGIAGFGYGAFSGVVAPELTGFALGTELIIWVALGGRGTLWGPLIGAVLINVATAYLSGSMPFAWQLIVGVAFVGVIVLLPQGLVPLLLKPFGLGRIAAREPVLEVALARGGARQRAAPALRMHRWPGTTARSRCCKASTWRRHAGELVGLIGPNGAGKTTLMRCMSDGAERSAGTVRTVRPRHPRLPPEACVRFGLGASSRTPTSSSR
jgi:branched-chain amino acid transport system permease protein